MTSSVYGIGRADDVDFSVGAAGIAMDVGEAFLHDAEQRHLDFGGETAEIGEMLTFELDAAALLKTFGVPADGGAETGFVEQRGMEQIGKRANFFADHANDLAAFVERFLALGFLRVEQARDAIERHGERGDFLAGRVVEIARDAAALFVLKLEQAAGQLTERRFGDAESFVGFDEFGQFGGDGAQRFHAELCAARERETHGARAPGAIDEANFAARVLSLPAFLRIKARSASTYSPETKFSIGVPMKRSSWASKILAKLRLE